MVIDFHHHLLATRDDYVDGLLRAMDETGVEKVCLNGLGVPSDNWLGDTSPGNDEVLAAARRHPDRIIPIGVVRLGVHTAADVARLHDDGFMGYKTTRPLVDYDDPSLDPTYAAMEDTGLSLLAHTGFIVASLNDRADNVSSSRCRPENFDRVARSFPGLRIVMAHLGMPWFEEAAQMCRYHANVYTDLSGSLEGWRGQMRGDRLSDLFYWPRAFEKVVFGSDVHYSQLPDALRDYHRILAPARIDNETMDGIMNNTALSLIRPAVSA